MYAFAFDNMVKKGYNKGCVKMLVVKGRKMKLLP